jgi:hypothetical protein
VLRSLANEDALKSLDGPASLAPQVADVYAQFSALLALAKEHFDEELGGKLLLYGQLDARGAAVALAANIAGAATLGVDADSERLRQGIRHGFCDFVVNHFDEALRILKNELRKKQPVSVCLEGDLEAALSEAVKRGLQPDLLALTGKSDAIETLIERGAIPFGQKSGLETKLEEITWAAETSAALWLPKVDALAAQVLPAGDERSRWLKLASRYLGRTMAGEHYLQMTPGEAGGFSELVAGATASGSIGTKITIQRVESQARQRQR